jgi:AbrB family looped-hinge helix DNA binding protein
MRTRLSSKGQLVLPKEARANQGWTEGTEIEVEDSRVQAVRLVSEDLSAIAAVP